MVQVGRVVRIIVSLQSDLVLLLKLRQVVLALQPLRQRVRFVDPKFPLFGSRVQSLSD